jgi:peptidoglycan/LPS O-acetylase OafA/YrhL
MRRFLRLYPTLLVMVVVTTAVFIVAAPPEWQEHTLSGAVLAMTFLANLARGLWRTPIEPFEHTWSLAMEVQFYLLWPVVLGVLCRVARGRVRTLAWSVAALLIAGVVWATGYYLMTRDLPHLYTNLDGRGVQLMLGALAAVLVHGGVLHRSPGWVTSSVAVLAGVGSVFLASLLVWQPFGEWDALVRVIDLPLCGLAATFVVLGVVAAPEGLLSRMLSHRLLVATGLLSYSLYLWHMPIIWLVDLHVRTEIVRVSLALGASAVLGLASFHLIEQPLRRARDRAVEAERLATTLEHLVIDLRGTIIDLRDRAGVDRPIGIASDDDRVARDLVPAERAVASLEATRP